MKTAPTGHARFSPSSAEKWLNCPAWYKLSKDKPRTSNASADEGSARHEAAAYTLLSLIREVTEGKEASVKGINEDDLEQYVLPIIHWLKEDPDNRTLHVETELKPPGMEDPDVWGTCDAYGVDTKNCEVHIWDLKTGHKAVDSAHNVQLGQYALLIQTIHGIDAFNPYRFFFHIVQGVDKVWEADQGWLLALEKRTEVSILVAQDENPCANAGSWCKYCPAEQDCPARRQEIAKVESAILSEEIPTLVASSSSEYLANILDMAERIEDFIGNAKAELMKRGGLEGRYKIVESETKRAWNDIDQDNIISILRSKGVKEPTVAKLITLGDAEKALVKAGQPKPIAKQIIESLTVKGKGKATLAPWSDKRPAITQQDDEV